jgi:hypothetical protein
MFNNIKNDRYGSLLFFEGRNRSDDPFKNYKVLKRRGREEVTGLVRFSTPDDKDPVKVSRLMLLGAIECDSNFVPVNDWHAKCVKGMAVRMLDDEVDTTSHALEYTLISFYSKLLNFSVDAKEVELFPSGTYDSRDLDGSHLAKHSIKHNGLSLVENRQKYAEKIWREADEKTTLYDGGPEHVYKLMKHKYHVRAPIAHGLCRQPKVIPSGSRLQFDVTLASWSNALQKHDDYQMCRTSVAALEESKFKWPLSKGILTETFFEKHYDPTKCNCAELKAKFGDKCIVKQVYEGNNFFIADDVATLYDKTFDTVKNVYPKYQLHSVEVPIIKYEKREEMRSDGTKAPYGVFWKENIKGSSKDGYKLSDSVKITDHVLEAVYCTPGAKEKPLSKSGAARIPFLSPKLKIVNFPAGQRTFEIVLSDGAVPHMVIFSGQPYRRRISAGIENCVTRTSMREKGFEIEELVICIDNDEVFRTPWRRPVDHYINFLKATGRYHNKAIGGTVDFFRFQNENWCVPLKFDDRHERRALITAKITFRKELEASWDAFVTRIPVEDLMLDRKKNGRALYTKLFSSCSYRHLLFFFSVYVFF